MIFLDKPALDENNNHFGSCFQGITVRAAGILTPAQIIAQHDLTPTEYYNIEKQILKMKLLDILFSFPQGPRYDALGHLWATCR